TNVIGELPRLRSLRRNDRALVDILEEGTTVLSESFKSLRANLEIRIAAEQPRAIAVSSYQMGEGKTSVAAGVGWALASVGHTVIAIDADLRRPALHHRLGGTMGRGLADLAGHDINELLRPTVARGLRFLPAGLPDRSPADVVAVNLPSAIDKARLEASVVIVDAPPLEMVAETRQVISTAGHVILVVDAGSVNLPELANAVAELREQGAELLGVVINRVRRRWWTRSYDYYSFASNTQGLGD
ncbi:MAG: CpsD/CapB family tyrosine-protein kinase, partial [Actinobacteria bacterium]|nr:CpsD/CapB family tyrosine-protein kinase [Actinomycetota bacterium]